MRKYNQSDYAINKYAEGFVYRSVTGTYEICQDDFLKQYPEEEERYLFLKEISDELYKEIDRVDTRQARRQISLDGLEEIQLQAFPVDDLSSEFEVQEMKKAVGIAWKEILRGNTLTQKQKNRLKRHILKGESARQIAKWEGVSHVAVAKSLLAAKEKLKKVYEKEIKK